MKDLIEILIYVNGYILTLCLLLLLFKGLMKSLFFLARKINKIDYFWLLYLASQIKIRRGEITKDKAIDILINWSCYSLGEAKNDERRRELTKRLKRRLEKLE